MEKQAHSPRKTESVRVLGSDPRLTLQRQCIEISTFSKSSDERFEMSFYEEILQRDPCNEDVLMMLGHVYSRRGDYQKGLDVDRRLVRLRPNDPMAFYNLACSLSLLRMVDEALATIERAVALGYKDMSHMLKDPDLANLRQDERFRRLLAKLVGETTKAS